MITDDTETSESIVNYSHIISNAALHRKVRTESTDSFNLYNGVIYEKPESPKHAVSTSFVNKLLVATLSIISLLILILATNHHSAVNNESSSVYGICHENNADYSMDKECAIDICNERGVEQILSLKFGWNSDFAMLRKYDALNMLYSIDDEHEILPKILYLNTLDDETEFMEFENVSIALGNIQMIIKYFCCYPRHKYLDIKTLFKRFSWKQFDIRFGNYSCLNKTDGNQIEVVSLLNEESQSRMTQWENMFEDFLVFNGVDVESKSEEPLFYSTFAVFDAHFGTFSVDFVNELNAESNHDWQDIVVSFSKMNLYMT